MLLARFFPLSLSLSLSFRKHYQEHDRNSSFLDALVRGNTDSNGKISFRPRPLPSLSLFLVYPRDGRDILLLNGLPSAARTRHYITLRRFLLVALVHARTTDSPHAVPNLPRVELFSYLRSIGMRVYRPTSARNPKEREAGTSKAKELVAIESLEAWGNERAKEAAGRLIEKQRKGVIK